MRLADECLQVEWRARDIHPRDSGLPQPRQAESFTEQALKDTDAAIIRLFRMLPEIEVIRLQVLRPLSFGGVILTGVVHRARALDPNASPSPGMRLIMMGVSFKMDKGHLALLPVSSWGPMPETRKAKSASRAVARSLQPTA
jgi:hypothetical protein